MAKVSIGGQAVMEGVMMKNMDKYAVAVRKPDKDIDVKVTEFIPYGDRCKLFKLPIIRGVVNFLESFVIGMRTLMYSAEFFEDEEETGDINDKKIDEEHNIEQNKDDVNKKDRNKKDSDSSDALMMYGTLAVSLVIAIGLFMLLPAFLVSLIDGVIKSHIVLSIIEGAVRLLIFLLYVIIISRMEDIKRTFMYHGAEHKTINCLEGGHELTVDNVMKSSRFHKRCGTSFLFIVMIVSIIVFMFIKTDVIWWRFVSRILLVPVIAGISYEFIRFAGKNDGCIANCLSKPGLMIQRLTTKEPTEDMVEVAIKSVEGVLDWKAYLKEQKEDIE